MPRIDPLQLIKCLSVLLSPEGGIHSRDEVPRLVNLMTKFSKKLVSKCVYVLILKNTETSLVDMFMAEGGWTLIQSWLQDAAQSGNWDLVKEILELLLITPVDVERLKMNCLPKLIKNLSRRDDLDGVAHLSNQIVQNWLVIVKGSSHPTPVHSIQGQEKPDSEPAVVEPKNVDDSKINKEIVDAVPNDVPESDKMDVENHQAIKPSNFYKVSVKDGKQVIKKLSLEADEKQTAQNEEFKEENEKEEKVVEKENDKSKSSLSSSKSSSKSSSSSSKDKERDKRRSSSSHSSSKSSSKSSSSSKDKDRKDRDKDKDKHRHNGSSRSSRSSSSSSKDKKDSRDKSKVKDPGETKEKQAEKDKDTLEKVKPPTLDKLGRIPKKSSSSDEKQKENKSKEEKKKPSFSILNRKATGEEPRSKTVKVFNSKMRSTGLEEEAKPPPPRSTKKPTPSVQLPTIPQKRPSPPRDPPSGIPPEKKLKIDKIDVPERPGAIKLIPPKPKPPVLQESDMFMDALNASAPKKEAKKRKRRPSVTKDTPTSPSIASNGGDANTPTSPTSPTGSLGLKNITPINFYQDTLSETSEKKEEQDENNENNDENAQDSNDTPVSPTTPTDEAEVDKEEPVQRPLRPDGLRGVLLYTKKKGPKRSIKWKAEEDLVEVRYFELDETERVNVTKTFMDMAKMEMNSEREALIMSRKLSNEDVMEPQIMWRFPYLCDLPDPLAPPGSKSLEKDIQFAREKTVLPALYYDKRRIPDSPEEPIPENHQMSDPVIIPLDDPDSQEVDLRSTPWPEPKGPAPQMDPPQAMPPMFQNMPFNPNFPNMNPMNQPPQFAGVGVPPPRFGGPMGPVPGSFPPPNMMHGNMVPPMGQQDMMNQPPMNPNMFGGPVPDGFMAPPGTDPNFHMQPQFNGPQGPNMNMFGGPNNFNPRGRGGFRGRANGGGWVRMSGPGNWKRGGGGGGGGGGGRGGRLCKNIQNHGYCRNGDNCPFVHPS